MTFCLAMKVQDGLVGIADTRVTSGKECMTAKKVTVHQKSGRHAAFIMTSGLRSLRDKAVTYFQEVIEQEDQSFNKLYKMVNAFGEQVKRVAQEDRKSLEEHGLAFNLFALVAGQLEDDKEPMLYMLYPEGNWVEVGEGSPYFIIGNTGHGKPLLDRALKYQSSVEFALKVGFLSFNATRVSANDVEYPIDVVVCKKDDFHIVQRRFEREDMNRYSVWWQERIAQSIHEMPDDWVDMVFEQTAQMGR
ncbi:MAG: peptidase [Candidatus Omnitrophica bacterium]|nr:peptidase [Candidatus Omnitrophota bacterium]